MIPITTGNAGATNAPRPQWISQADVHARTSNTPGALPPSAVPPTQTGTNAGTSQGFAPTPVFLPTLYGDGILQPFAFAAAGSQLVLPRPPTGKRVLLIIVNTIAGFTINVNFDAPAAALIGIPFVTNGGLFMDRVVVQNDIHIFAPAAGVIQVAYMIADERRPVL